MSLVRRFKVAARDAVAALLAIHAKLRLKRPRQGRPHDLPDELIVSLTSYPPRFPTLNLTLGCLLDQTVKPDHIFLWIASADIAKLPPVPKGIEVRECDDCRSFKKLVPAIETYPDATIVTADDDVYYPPRWLETILNANDGRSIVGHHARRVKTLPNGSFAPYLDWPPRIHDGESPSDDIMPTGVGGILYPPRSLHATVVDRAMFRSLCAEGDDLWFYWCGRLAGSKFKTTGRPTRLFTWPGTQDVALFNRNEQGNNDVMLSKLAALSGRSSKSFRR